MTVKLAPTLKLRVPEPSRAGEAPASFRNVPIGIAVPGPVKVSPVLNEIVTAVRAAPVALHTSEAGVPSSVEEPTAVTVSATSMLIVSPAPPASSIIPKSSCVSSVKTIG